MLNMRYWQPYLGKVFQFDGHFVNLGSSITSWFIMWNSYLDILFNVYITLRYMLFNLNLG